jgi:hypothetical protein
LRNIGVVLECIAGLDYKCVDVVVEKSLGETLAAGYELGDWEGRGGF